MGVTLLVVLTLIALWGLNAQTKNWISYEAAAQVTISNASLASGSTRESATFSNSGATNPCFDRLVALTFTIASGTPGTNNPSVNVYAGGSAGTIWPIVQLSSGAVKATGAGDASIGALGTPPNLRLVGSFGIQTTTSNGERTFRTEQFSTAAAFNGTLPAALSWFVENQTGVAFSSSTVTTANYFEQEGVYTTSGN